MNADGWLGVIGAGALAVAISLVAMRLLGRRRTTTLGRTAQALARHNAKLVHAAGQVELAELQRTEAVKTNAVLDELSEEVNSAAAHPAGVFNRRR